LSSNGFTIRGDIGKVFVWAIKVKGHCDWSESMSWSVSVVIILSVKAWSVGITLLESWLEKFVKPVFGRIHAGLTAVVHDVINRVVFLKSIGTVVAAWVSWLWLVGWVEESIDLGWSDVGMGEDIHLFGRDDSNEDSK